MLTFDKERSMKIAQDFLGMKYKMNGRGEDGNIDCYGILVSYFKEFGVEMPDFTLCEDWDGKEEYYLKRYSSRARRLSTDERPECGDFILFKNVEGASNHAGVYLGDNRFVHSYRKIGVKIDSLSQKPWKEKVSGYFRIVEDKE